MWGWVVFGLACAVLVVQAVSLYYRGAKEESDVGVFYRTARLLDAGAGAELYEERDSKTGWPIAIPPVGMAFFQSVSRLGPGGLAAVWAVFNVVLVGLGVWFLRGLVSPSLFPWMAAVWLVLAGGSVQVGQFSVLFALCWIVALRASSWAGPWLWALPAAIKLYPALLFFTSLSRKDGLRVGLATCGALIVLFFVVPYVFYGGRAWDLNASFIENVVLDPSGRVKWMQALGTTANQGLDAVLIRYLSWYPKFHERYSVPTAGLDLDTVRLLGHVLRLLVLAVTIGAFLRVRRKGSVPSLLVSAAVWSSAMYVMLPETRARYAVYTVLAFVVLSDYVSERRPRAWGVAGLVLALLLVLGAMPEFVQVLGLGFLGPLGLWIALLVLLPRLPSSPA